MKNKILGILGALVIMAGCILVNVYTSNKVISDNAKSIKNSKEEETPVVEKEESIVEKKEESKPEPRVAVVYFSAFDDVETVSEYIRDEVKGELFEIVAEKEYTETDVAYNNSNSRSAKESKDSKVRPEIKDDIKLDEFGVVYLGYPIWRDDVPKIILTLLDETDLSGKTVIPFSADEDNEDITNSVSTLKEYNEDVNWIDGKVLEDNKDKVVEWIGSLEY